MCTGNSPDPFYLFISACPAAAPPKGAEQDKHKMMIEQSDIMHSVSWKTEVKHDRLSVVTTAGGRVTAWQGCAPYLPLFLPAASNSVQSDCTSPSDETTDVII